MLHLLVASSLLGCAVVIYKLPILWKHRRDPSVWAYWVTFLAMALSNGMLHPPMYQFIDHHAGISNLAALLSDIAALGGGWSLLAYLYFAKRRDPQARRAMQRTGWLITGTILLLIGIFAATNTGPDEPVPQTILPRYGGAPLVAPYRFVFLGAMGLLGGAASRQLRTYRHLVPWGTMGGVLRALTLCTFTSIGYVAGETGRVIAQLRGAPGWVTRPASLAVTILFAGLLLLVGSTTLPSWGPRVSKSPVRQWLRHYRAYRQLYPLRDALHNAFPAIALVKHRRSALADALRVKHLGFHLCGRVLEIGDGRARLRPYENPRAAPYARELCQATGTAHTEVAAIAAAANLAVALHAHGRNRQTSNYPDSASTPAGIPTTVDLESELASLLRVAHHYRHSAVVRAVLAQLDQEPQDDSPRPYQLSGEA